MIAGCTNVASNIAVYKSDMPLQKTLKEGQWSNAAKFFTYCFREIEQGTGLNQMISISEELIVNVKNLCVKREL